MRIIILKSRKHKANCTLIALKQMDHGNNYCDLKRRDIRRGQFYEKGSFSRPADK